MPLCEQCGNCEFYVEFNADEGSCENSYSVYFEEIMAYDDSCDEFEDK